MAIGKSSFTKGAMNMGRMASRLAKLPKKPAIDPNYTNIVKTQQGIAQNYRNRLPELQQESYNLNSDITRRELAQGMLNADRASNRRGMLYGGVAAGNRSAARGEAAANMADRTMKSNQELYGNARDLENLAIKGGYDLRSDTQDAYNNIYNRALSDRTNSANQMNMFGNILGNTIGGLIGGSKAKPKTTMSTNDFDTMGGV